MKRDIETKSPLDHLKNLSLLRILFFSYMILMFWNHSFLQFVPGDFFHQLPTQGIFRILLVLNDQSQLEIILNIWKISVCCSLLGIFSPLAISLAFVSGLYKFGYSEGMGYSVFGVQLPLLINLLLIFCPCSSSYALIKSKEAPLYPEASFFFLRLIVCIYYFNAGLSKILEDGFLWFKSDQLAYIVNLLPYKLPVMNDLLIHYGFIFLPLGMILIVIELTSPLALLSGKFALFYTLAWGTLHLAVTGLLKGHDFFLWQIPCYMVFITNLRGIISWALPKFLRQKFF